MPGPFLDRTRWAQEGGWKCGRQLGGVSKTLKGEAAAVTCSLDPGPGEAAQGSEHGRAKPLLCLLNRRGHWTSVSLGPRLPWGHGLQAAVGVTVHEVPVHSRGSRTAILLALRPYGHSAHPRPMPWGQPMESRGKARLRGRGLPPRVESPGRKSCAPPRALPTGLPTALERGLNTGEVSDNIY